MTDAVSLDIESFVKKHQDPLRRYLRLLGCHPDSCDDLAQEAFLEYLRSKEAPDAPAHASRWLRRCAANLLKSSKRKAARRDTILREEAAERIWAKYRLDERPSFYREALKDCLSRLPRDMGEIIDLIYRDGLSGSEVARAQAKSETDVWTIAHRARKKLRACIDWKLKHES